MIQNSNSVQRTIRFFLKEKVLLCSIIMFMLVSVFSDAFLNAGNISNLLMQIGLYGIVALGMTFAIIGGEFDLGVGSMVSLSSVLVVVLYSHVGLALSVTIAILAGILIGIVNGFLVAKAKINSFIVTFGSMITLKGIALTVANGVPVSSRSEGLNAFGDARILGISLIFIMFAVLLLICHWVLTYTRFGRNIFAIGGNFNVASATGLKVNFLKGSLFVLTGFFAAISGVLMAARLNTGHPTVGDDIALTVIASVVIGGTSLSGGKGNVFRTLLGVFVMMFLSNAFDSLVIQPYIQRVIKGLIIISVVAVDSYNKKKINISEGNIITRISGYIKYLINNRRGVVR